MTIQTKLSAKGQVVIPKDVRDRLRWTQGQALDVVETADGVLLKRPQKFGTLTVQEALERIRGRVKYTGPPLSVEEMNEAIDEMYVKSAMNSDLA